MAELGRRMDSAEFAEWTAFARLEPWGSAVDDQRFGTLASAAVAPWGGTAKPGDWFRWADGGPKPAGGWRHILGAFDAYAKGRGPAEQAGQ